MTGAEYLQKLSMVYTLVRGPDEDDEEEQVHEGATAWYKEDDPNLGGEA